MSRWRFILPTLTLTFFFLGLMLLPGLDLLFDINPFPPLVENRSLKEFPPWPRTLSEVQQFPGEFDAWLNDHMGFRSVGIRLLNMIKYTCLNVSGNPKVIAGKDRFLFLGSNNVAYHMATDLFTQEELIRWKEWLEHKQRWLADQGTTFILVIVPSKAGIYPEKLPDWWRQLGKQKRWEQLRDYLIAQQSPLLWVDTRTALLEAKNRGEPVYFQRDSHWTQLGAYYGAMSILSFLEPLRECSGKQIPRLTFKEVNTHKHNPDLARMLGVENFWYEFDYRKPPQIAEFKLKRNYDNIPLRAPVRNLRRRPFAIGNGISSTPTAVIFHDSFGEGLVNSLGIHFRWCVFSHYVNGFNSIDIRKIHPDFCLLIMVDRAFENILLRSDYTIGFKIPD